VQSASEGARSIWDEYRLLGEQFRGPATVAWSAEHLISGRRARLTTVHAPPMASAVTAEAISHAFRRAAERAREFAHPDNLPVIGIAEQSGLPVAVTMLGDGAPMSERLAAAKPLGEAMKQISQIGHAVAALHAAGSRHGYLIPENLWVRSDGRIALLDAGLHAAAAHAAFASGFPVSSNPYLPVADDAYAEANQGTDVYSLVALLVRLVTGRLVPPEHLPAAVEALPDTLPDSLRAELRDAVAAPRPATAPTARSLAVHLAFDTAWIRARERSQSEQDLVEGEVLKRETPDRAGDDVLARWARTQPPAGVRGGAASTEADPPTDPEVRPQNEGRSLWSRLRGGPARRIPEPWDD
jgi:eukaryotic-like serine/threonine-protein kinase